MTPRLAIVRQGEFVHSLADATVDQPLARRGIPESLAALRRLQQSCDHQVFDHAVAIAAFTQTAARRMPRWPHPSAGLTRGLIEHYAGLGTYWSLSRYRPTHLLLCDDGPVGFYAAWYAQRHKTATLAAFFGRFEPRGISPRSYVGLLNQRNVCCVANLGRHSVQAMLGQGLSPRQATAYELEPDIADNVTAPRARDVSQPLRIRYQGTIRTDDGPFELVAAVSRLADNGMRVALEVIGDGPAWSRLRNLAHSAPQGLIRLRHPFDDLGDDAALDAVDVAYVASGGAPGSPLSEAMMSALRARVPVVAPEDPLFSTEFRHGEGLLLHRPGDLMDLARQLQRLASDAELYRAVSSTTREAYRRARGRTTLAELIDAWRLVIASETRNTDRDAALAIRQTPTV